MDELRRSYWREKIYCIIEMRKCQWKLHMRENHEIKSFVRSNFPTNVLRASRTYFLALGRQSCLVTYNVI